MDPQVNFNQSDLVPANTRRMVLEHQDSRRSQTIKAYRDSQVYHGLWWLYEADGAGGWDLNVSRAIEAQCGATFVLVGRTIFSQQMKMYCYQCEILLVPSLQRREKLTLTMTISDKKPLLL